MNALHQREKAVVDDLKGGVCRNNVANPSPFNPRRQYALFLLCASNFLHGEELDGNFSFKAVKENNYVVALDGFYLDTESVLDLEKG